MTTRGAQKASRLAELVYVGGRWHTFEDRLYDGTESQATYSKAGAGATCILRNMTHLCIYAWLQTYTPFDAKCKVISAWFELLALAVNFLCAFFFPPLTPSSSHTIRLTHPSLSLVCHPLPLPGSVLRHPPAGAVHQGGAWQCVPQGGTERAPGQRRESRHHQETWREGRDQTARTEEVLVSMMSCPITTSKML